MPSTITACLRRRYLSAWLADVYFAHPGCGFAILIFGIIWVLKPAQRGCFIPRLSPPGIRNKSKHPVVSLDAAIP